MFTPLKKITLILSLVALAILGYFFKSFLAPKPSEKPVVAITQIVPHPSLDSIRQGILDTLKGQDISIVFQDAQGNMATATQIAQRFVALNPKVVVPITTPSAQALYVVAKERGIPLIFAAVTDPIAAKLTPSYEGQPDVAGVYDALPILEQAKIIQEAINPKTVGILYNPGETNSVVIVEKMTQTLQDLGMAVVKAPVTTTLQASTTTRSLVGQVQVIYIANDNTVISALESILQVTNSEKIPIFCSDPESVERGALMALGPNQYAMGQQVGKMIQAFLEGKPLEKIGIQKPQSYELLINLKTARHLGIHLHPSIIDKANKTFDETQKN